MRTKERKRERRERAKRSVAGIRKGKEKRGTFVGGGSGKREREREREEEVKLKLSGSVGGGLIVVEEVGCAGKR